MKLSPICQTVIQSKSNPLSPVVQNSKKIRVQDFGMKENSNLLEIRVNQLVEENKSVNLQLNEKIKENEQLRSTLAHMEIELNKLKGIEHELILVKEISDVRFADFEKYKTQAEQLYQELTEIQGVFQDSQTKIQQQQEEIQQWKIRYAELDSTRLLQLQEIKSQRNQGKEDEKIVLHKTISDLENNVELLQEQLETKEQQLRTVAEEMNLWKIKFSKIQVQQKQNLQDREKDSKIQMLIDEIERLNDLVCHRNDEIMQLKRITEKTAQLISISQRQQRSASGQKYK